MLLCLQVSQRPQRALPAANPALYAAAIEGGYKPNAYLTDYHDPFGGVESHTRGNTGAHWGINVRDHQLTHPMHPHISLVNSLQNPYGTPYTQCGVPLG